MAVTEDFYENKFFVAKLLLQSVESTGDGIRAFLIFDLKQDNFQQSVKFYTQYVEYQCNENFPILLEEKLISESNGQGSLNAIREEVRKSYNSLYGQLCI